MPGSVEVIVPAITFVAIANAGLYCGATPCTPTSGRPRPRIDPVDAEARIAERTHAIFRPCTSPASRGAIERLRALCDARGPRAAGGRGARAERRGGGRKLGTFGLAGAFSFFFSKVLSVGERWMLATDDDGAAAIAPADVVDRLDEPRAALLLARLAHMETRSRAGAS